MVLDLKKDFNKSTDEEIIVLYKNNQKEAFKVLIDRYSSPIYNFVVRLTNRNDAPDIVQDAFVKVWKSIHHFDPTKANFKTWVFAIAKNTATDYLRKKKSIVFSDMGKPNDEEVNYFAENIADEAELPDSALEKLQDSIFLNKTLEKLSPSYQEVLVLHYQEGMTFEEIGEVLEKPLNTVKSQHRRAIIELRKIID